MFRWWGVGTSPDSFHRPPQSVSSVPMVGCRNRLGQRHLDQGECIKCSDGGVSEPMDSSSRA